MNQSNITQNSLGYAPRNRARYDDAWNKCWTYANDLLSQGRDPDNDLADKLHGGLIAWGMARVGVRPKEKLRVLLSGAWPYLRRLHQVDLDTLNQNHRADLAAAYDALREVTAAPLVTGTSKALLLVWGGAPAFDAKVRANARASRSSAGEVIWPYAKSRTRLAGSEFADAILALARAYQSTATPDLLTTSPDTHGRRLDRALHYNPV